MDPFLQKVHARPIHERYSLVRKLGQGGFGAVYIGRDTSNDNEVALKLEHHKVDPSILRDEADTYKAFQDVPGFPRILWFGEHDDFRVLVMELLGPSLEDVFAFCENRFSLKTTLMLVDQLLDRLECLHSAGFVHRDIKPDNFMLGSGSNGNVVYLADFGIAEEYKPRIKYADEKDGPDLHLIGTARFASIRGHRGSIQSPKDDMESLGYMLVFFMQGKLPWQGLEARDRKEKEQATLEMKRNQTPEQLCEGLPQEFVQYLQDVQSLRATDTPDYAKFRQLFRRLAEREGLEYDNIFDWTERIFLESKQANGKL